jgi:PAS domain S-box-containing protein
MPVPPGPELRDLTMAFNAMSRNLRQSHDSLEERVRQRTAELNHLNERLEQDILQRKQMEEELQASEEKYRMVGEYNYDWEYWISPTGTLIYISPSCQRITGFTPEEFIANPRLIMAIIHPEDQEMMAAHLQEAMQDHLEVCELEFRIITKDGEERWLRHSCQSVYRDQNIWMGRRASNQDITERKQVEEKFLKEKQFSETIIDSLPGVFYVFTDQGRFLRWNANFEQVTGYTAAEFAELTPLDFIAGEDKNLMAQAMQVVFSRGATTAEAELVTKDGGKIPYFFSGRRLDLDDGPCLVGTAMDITARKQAEETLRSTRDYLENIFANSADGIGLVGRDGKFTRWNKAAEEIYGYTFEELKGRSAFELYADPGELDVMMKQLRQHGFIRNYEINMKKKDGSVFPASLSIKILRDSNKEVIGSITGSRDLSDTKRTMMQLQNEIYQHEQARQALLESEQNRINIIDFLPDATFVIDTKGKVISWNRAIEEMTGVKAKDMVGKGNYEYALPLYGERKPILIDLVLRPEKGIEKYDEVHREDGVLTAVAHLTNLKGEETYQFAKASALINSHGNIIGSIETIRDITALRKAATDRLQFSKLESMSILAGGIAHDFNNILTTILGNIGLTMLRLLLNEGQ